MYLRRIRTLPAIGVLAVAYFVAAKIGLHMATVHKSASPVWPPSGLALAAVLLCGYRVWPGIFIGAFCANALTAGNLITSFCIAGGNALEALGVALLVNQFAGGIGAFDSAQRVFKFAAAVVIGDIVSPFIGVTALAGFGYASWPDYGPIWLTWWLGDISGSLLLAPAFVLWGMNPRRRFDPSRDLEVGALLAIMILLATIVFGGWFWFSAHNYPVAFLLGPVIVWTAFRLSQRETATGIFILSIFAIWGTLSGFGPFVRASSNQSLLILQAFNAVTTITALGLAAGMAERRRAEAAIEQQRATVEAASKTKDNFLAMLSHELRTPLTPVIAALDALESAPSQSEESRASLAMIRRNVELESQLIDDLLDLTRIARDKLQLRTEIIDAHQCIANVAEICRMEANSRHLSVHLNLHAGGHFIVADPAKFQQILWNLLKNAIKFTPEKGDISITTGNPRPQTLEILVRDTGIGLDPEVMKRMFEPFEQGDLSFQHRYGGLGLGLAICKALAEAHGATLEANSEGANKGAAFTMRIGTVSPPTSIAANATVTPPAGRAGGLRILLVDDHHDTCTALERLLVRRGHLVATTHTLRSAMEAGARNKFDLLISDIALPDGTGIELMTYLRAMSPIRGIAISGFGMDGDIARSEQAGFAEHLVKPVKIDALEAAIDRVITSS